MIDSHCHLADKGFSKDISEVLDRALAAGVDRMITIADSINESERCLALAEKFDQLYCTVGVHPHGSKEWTVGSGQQLQKLAQASKKVRAIGEIGLDYHYDFSPRDAQQKAFADQLILSQELKLPVVVHNRESIEDLKKILKEHPPVRMVLHCCTEKWEDVSDLVEKGYFLSFTGIATYPKSDAIRDTIKHCPIGQLMIETDAPYLAPVPHRGKRNEPAFVVEVAKIIASVKGISFEEVDQITSANTERFFSIQ